MNKLLKPFVKASYSIKPILMNSLFPFFTTSKVLPLLTWRSDNLLQYLNPYYLHAKSYRRKCVSMCPHVFTLPRRLYALFYKKVLIKKPESKVVKGLFFTF